jgi:enoyl-CoA hydratase/carnithine racemase
MGELTRSAVSGRTAWIKLADPDRRNALTQPLIASIREDFGAMAADPSVRVIVLSAEGDHFCAGGDIGAFDLGVVGGRDYVHDIIGLFRLIEHCRKPVIAAVRGFAFGGGFELAMSCDLIVAGTSAKLSLPEIGVGAIPGYAIVRLPELIGRQRAKHLMWTAERMDAARAAELGLVTSVVVDTELEKTAQALADRVGGAPRVATELIKAAVNCDIADRALFESTTAASLLWGTESIKEGKSAFYEHRPAVFPEE